MRAFHFRRWFARPAECGSPVDLTPVVAPTLPAPHAPRPVAAGPAVQVSVIQSAADLIIRVKGEASVKCAGALLDGLLAPAARRPAVVILDLTELRSISCLPMPVLVAYPRAVLRTPP